MGKLKSELSKKNEYSISKHRYYELQHHCMQYSEWKRMADSLINMSPDTIKEKYGKTNDISDPVGYAAEKRERYLAKIERIRRLCKTVDEECYGYLLACVTGGYSYDSLEAQYGTLPCSRVSFYKFYRRFFKMLDDELA